VKKLIWLICLGLLFLPVSIMAQSDIEPVEVTAVTGPVYQLAGEVEYTLKFWNVGAQNPDSQYSKATLEAKCLQAEGGWQCSDLDQVQEGIFGGGPNGTFSFGEASFELADGKTAVLPADGFTLTFTVTNPEAFDGWQTENQNVDLWPVLEKRSGNVTGDKIRSGSWLDKLAGKKQTVEFPVGSTLQTKDGQAVVKYPDGSRLIVLENSAIRFTNDGIYMDQGAVYFDVKKQPSKFLLQDSRANYVILGTKFFWDTDSVKTIFDLMEGAVEIDRLGMTEDSVTLITGESVVVSNEGFAEIENFEVDQRLAEMQAIDEGMINEPEAGWPIKWTVGIVVVLVLLFGGYLWMGKQE